MAVRLKRFERWRAMPRGRRGAIPAVIVVLAVGGGAGGAAGSRAATRAAPHHGATASLASSLSDSQLAGQRVIYSYRGLEPPAALLRAIRAGKAAGVVFFSDNISSKAQLRTVAAALQKAAADSPVKLPLLLMTDQEGGLVRRLPGAPVDSEKQIGSSSHPAAAARQAGRGAGLNLKGAGLNVNLAPVLDVYRAAGDFIDQYGRSYSSDPDTVSALGADFITAQQRVGVAATAKHFPGLGAATRSQDTDTRPVTLNVSLSALRKIDELPYRAAIAADVKLVMVSWAKYPALDRTHPAGLSAKIVGGELRDRLHFKGVTITDALGAGALRPFGIAQRRAVDAAAAGMDLLLCARTNDLDDAVSQGAAAAAGLAQALAAGRLGRTTFVASVNRVMALRRSLER